MVLFCNDVPYRLRSDAAVAGKPSRPGVSVLFALLALLTQFVVGMLPMPATARDTDWSICSIDPGANTKRNDHHTPGHFKPCPVCMAMHLAGATLPPPDVSLGVITISAEITRIASEHAAPGRTAFRAQQARGPPASEIIQTT